MAKLLNQSTVDFTDPEKGDAVRGMFAGIAGKYDQLNHLLSFNQDKRWRRVAVKLSGVGHGDAVLDVCCGTGDLSFAFKGAVGESGSVHGTDFTPEMIEIAKDKSQKLGTVDFAVADTLKLPFEDNRFDACSVGFGIRNVQDVKGGLQEMARVVKQGGRVVVLEFTRPKSGMVRFFNRIYMNQVVTRVGQLISKSKEGAYSYLPDSVELFPDAESFSALMREVGLKDVRYKLMNFGAVAVHVGVKG